MNRNLPFPAYHGARMGAGNAVVFIPAEEVASVQTTRSAELAVVLGFRCPRSCPIWRRLSPSAAVAAERCYSSMNSGAASQRGQG